MPRVVEPDPCAPIEATGACAEPAELPELKPLQASASALCSEGEPAAAPEPPCLPFDAPELANTGCPSWLTTPAVAPLSRAANCSPATAVPVLLPVRPEELLLRPNGCAEPLRPCSPARDPAPLVEPLSLPDVWGDGEGEGSAAPAPLPLVAGGGGALVPDPGELGGGASLGGGAAGVEGVPTLGPVQAHATLAPITAVASDTKATTKRDRPRRFIRNPSPSKLKIH